MSMLCHGNPTMVGQENDLYLVRYILELTGIIILSFSLCWQFVLLGICSGTESTVWCFGRRSPASVGRSECSLVHSDLYKVDQSINTILGHTRKDYSQKVTHIVYSTLFHFFFIFDNLIDPPADQKRITLYWPSITNYRTQLCTS